MIEEKFSIVVRVRSGFVKWEIRFKIFFNVIFVFLKGSIDELLISRIEDFIEIFTSEASFLMESCEVCEFDSKDVEGLELFENASGRLDLKIDRYL